VHGAVADHYEVPADILAPHATTLDYIVAAAAGWLIGTFGGVLEALCQEDAKASCCAKDEGGPFGVAL
jgi:hypothetical protein